MEAGARGTAEGESDIAGDGPHATREVGEVNLVVVRGVRDLHRDGGGELRGAGGGHGEEADAAGGVDGVRGHAGRDAELGCRAVVA